MEGQKPACGADLDHALPGKLDPSEVLVDGLAQVPLATGDRAVRQAGYMVEVASLPARHVTPDPSGRVDEERVIGTRLPDGRAVLIRLQRFRQPHLCAMQHLSFAAHG